MFLTQLFAKLKFIFNYDYYKSIFFYIYFFYNYFCLLFYYFYLLLKIIKHNKSAQLRACFFKVIEKLYESTFIFSNFQNCLVFGDIHLIILPHVTVDYKIPSLLQHTTLYGKESVLYDSSCRYLSSNSKALKHCKSNSSQQCIVVSQE